MFASINQRLAFGIAVSLSIHGLVLFVLSGVSVAPRGKPNGGKTIAVQLVPHAPEEERLEKAQKVISLSRRDEFKVRSSAHPVPETAAPQPIPAETKESVAQVPEGTATGIAIPRAIFLPWAQGLQVRPPSTGGQAESRPGSWLSPQQQAEMRAQMKVMQLNESLAKVLSEEGKDITGSCKPNRPNGGDSLRMECIPKALEKLMSAEKPRMLETLEALRVAGKQVDKIFIVFRGGQLTISFHEPEQKPKTRP
ncbi:MAG TPA: hypothetical protein VK149_05580 [Sideroxyarcus sp.]|nr:hypothetical protein [Sideroxyarcus sp.]